MARTIDDLRQLQALPLSLKIRLTQDRIRQWINEMPGVYVSFSGGKDSTVLLDIARQIDPDIPAVFFDTMEYPEMKEFVRTFDNVEIIKPKMSYRQVVEKYGYPIISKEVSECVYGARRYLTKVAESESIDRQTDRQTDRPYAQFHRKLCGLGEYSKDVRGGYDRKYRRVRGLGEFSKRESSIGKADGIAGEKEREDGEYP